MSRREGRGVPANAPVTMEAGVGERAAAMNPTWLGFFQEVSRRSSAVGDLIVTVDRVEARDGCLRCDGTRHRATEYPDLAKLLGTDASGMFQVPDIAPAFDGLYWVRAR